MEHINGQNNELTLIFPHGRVNCISAPNERFAKVVNRANITIAGNNNQVSMCFESEDKAEELLLSDGFLLIVKGREAQRRAGKSSRRCGRGREAGGACH